MSDRLLPQGFDALQPFVTQWAVASSRDRDQCRSSSLPEERVAFFNVAKDFIDPALRLLDEKPLDTLSEAEQRLMNLILSFAHVAMAVEIHGPNEKQHAPLRQRMKITRSTADQ